MRSTLWRHDGGVLQECVSTLLYFDFTTFFVAHPFFRQSLFTLLRAFLFLPFVEFFSTSSFYLFIFKHLYLTSFFRIPWHVTDPMIVTQIPLDSPQVPQDLLQKPRPPWFRPLRKKGARSSSSNHSESPEAGSLSPGADATSFATPGANDLPFSTPENGIYGAGALGGDTGPFSPGTDGMLAELLRAPAGSFDGATGDNIFGASTGDGGMAMSPADLLAMFGDGNGSVGSFGAHDFGAPDAFGGTFGRRSSDLGIG